MKKKTERLILRLCVNTRAISSRLRETLSPKVTAARKNLINTLMIIETSKEASKTSNRVRLATPCSLEEYIQKISINH